MTRRLTEPRLVVATHNRGKLDEIRALVGDHPVELVSAGDLGLPEPAETEASFLGNARIKAHAAARATGLPALADDSGIEVDALGGAPGVHTADWAETPAGRDFVQAMTRTWEALEAARRAGAAHRALPLHAGAGLARRSRRGLRGHDRGPLRLADARDARVTATTRCSSRTVMT